MNDRFLKRLGPQIKISNTLIEKELNKRIASLITDYKLTGSQISLMVYLYESKGRTVTQKEVADTFVLSHPTIRSIVRRMENNGLLEVGHLRSDRRQISLSLSEKGFNLLEQHIDDIYAVMDDVNHQIIRGLDEGEVQKFSEILTKVINNF
ncbi:MarR family winged helix-turn-helix transcriptional regulator [Ligilactobacillus acidipiscis]|uniref:MarR family winged helix-turn-helix transcriptional regulator n=1 Tax=Ligilactobacillus acidipiscis TaxID=89059 RepID=A0A921F7Q0_9LACO|nr:MarR family winged helix-turn-helix transcriptional regulator [Ligilactobacillus acidipiscis]WEV56845.1 MarR family winged helix-turn-helix transcriptional regulator [Ligilactobacillus acidipiscis]HJE96944.1 MarR family winged helix-turn-helix transcriptional regulator [Ligilactobacillus acidipiscis]